MKFCHFAPLAAFCLSLILQSSQTVSAQSPKISSLEELRAARAQLAARPRKLIANNDGCDCLYFPRDIEPTAQNFIEHRTSVLAGSQVGAISYCTISSGFGHFTHDTKAGTVLTRQGVDYGIKPDARNITADLIRQGTDTLRAVSDFAHRHGMESFWSMRMNDTHDVAHRPEQPYFLFPQLKAEHPEWLVGEHIKRTPFGRWSSVDYARPEIRELAFRYLEEVCQSYEVDGVELDFFRHLCYFKSVANGGKASADEVAAMTDLMRRIRVMTEVVGLKRQRPILVAMRLPDSTEFSRESGLDLETWLKDGLMDILITTDYFRLNPWQHSVELGHRYGVKVYPALTDPRVKGETRFHRASVPAYRARAAAAWAAGADGLYLFNLYDIDRKSPLWRELGSPEALAFTDKDYFLTDLDGKATAWLAGGDKHQTIPFITPTRPAALTTKRSFTARMTIADNLEAPARAGQRAAASLHLDLPGLEDPRRLRVALNGHALSEGNLAKGWVDWSIAPRNLRKGDNEIAVTLQSAAPAPADAWTLVYDGSALPTKPWLRDPGSAQTHEALQDGALLIADRGTSDGDVRYYRYPWSVDSDVESVVEARVKVVSGTSYLILTNGVSGERLEFSPDGIGLYHARKLRHAMNTSDAFHHYRVTIKGADLQVHVDGVLRINAPGALTPRAGYPRNEVAFGAANSPGLGEARWDEVKVRSASSTQLLQDIVLSIRYEAR